VLYKVNAEAEGEGQLLAEEFVVEGYPTFVVANADAQTIDRWWGFDTSEDFIDTLELSIADPTTIAEKKGRFERAPSARDAVTLGQYHLTRKEAVDAVNYLEHAIELGDPADAHEYQLAMAVHIGARDETLTLEQLSAAAERALASEHLEDGQRIDVVNWVVDVAGDSHPEISAVYIDRGLAITDNRDDDEGLARARQRLLITRALVVDGDKVRATELKRETLEEGWDEDPGALNGFAWWCFENEVNLEQAQLLALRGAELAETDDERAQILDTVAEIANLRGDRGEAVALIEQARRLDPDNAYYEEQIQRFTDGVAGGNAAAGAAD
jgi:tetratricopeptide (TPR) repeat protein